MILLSGREREGQPPSSSRRGTSWSASIRFARRIRPGPRTLVRPDPTCGGPRERELRRARTAARAAMAVSVRELRKAFGPKLAVAGIDLDIPHGCFFGLVGPNGAGKTTTLGMVTGLLRPDGGGVAIDGVDVWRSPPDAKRRIGVLPEDLRLFDG